MSEPCDPRVRVWVDFNDADPRGRVSTLREFCSQRVGLGDPVLASDDEGTEISGFVEAIDEDTVWIRLEIGCWECRFRGDGRCVCRVVGAHFLRAVAELVDELEHRGITTSTDLRPLGLPSDGGAA